MVSLPNGPPLTPGSAPVDIDLPADLNKRLVEIWNLGLRGKGLEPNEMAATIVRKKDGALLLMNIHKSGLGASSPDYELLPIDVTPIGSFHTHPYREISIAASLDGADAKTLITEIGWIKLVQSGRGWQFMHMRTGKTPKSSPPFLDNWNTTMRKDRGLYNLKMIGINTLTLGSLIEARILASHLGFAYYEGRDGRLTRVIP
jgi:hypothetical protein